MLKSGENPKNIKMRLAREIVTFYHDKKAAESAEKEFIKIFQKHEMPTDIEEKTMPKNEYEICDLLFETHLADSKGSARRLIEGGGVSIEEKRIEDPKMKIKLSKKPILIKVGKRHFLRVKS